MLVERSEILIKAGSEEAFDAAMRERGVPLLQSVPGVKWVKFGRGVENPDKFIILVEWKTMDAHTAFGSSPARPKLHEVIAPHSRGGAMEHFNLS